jgi:hypothetical protein
MINVFGLAVIMVNHVCVGLVVIIVVSRVCVCVCVCVLNCCCSLFSFLSWRVDTAYDFEEVVTSVAPHPTRGGAALFQTSSDRCFNRTAAGACRSALWLDNALLRTAPALVTRDVIQFEWSGGDRLLVSTWDPALDDPSFEFHTYARDAFLIDLYASSARAPPFALERLVQHCAGFLTTADALYAATRDTRASDSLSLWRAGRRGFDQLVPLDFPTPLQQTRFTICNSDEGSIFINVQHLDSKWGNLYVSSSPDYNGVPPQFVLSLERAARELTGTVYFAKCNLVVVVWRGG